MEPQIGEIWRDNDYNRYFLITDKYEQKPFHDSIPLTKWSFLHLNDGTQDGAFLQFFSYHCSKVD